MSNFEIFIIVVLCFVPILAFVMLLPKLKLKFNFKKKEKSTKTKMEPIAEIKTEEKPKETKVEETPKEVKPVISSNEISTEDFSGYLNKRKPVTKPQKVELPEGFVDRTMPYIPQRRMSDIKKPKTIAEEIESLSPELKAIIVAGVLDKKDYDEDI